MPRITADAVIVVFAKAPRPGEAKTRLIPRLGADGAAALHARLVQHALATASRAAPGAVELCCTPDADDPFLRACAGRCGAALTVQHGANLGARMRHAVERVLASGRHALIIGTDCPVLTPDMLRDARDALARGHDAVFIPAEDGGYALIGLARCDRTLFDGIAWGGDAVMAATRDRLRALGWSWQELDTVWDVDRPADYDRLLRAGLLADSGVAHA